MANPFPGTGPPLACQPCWVTLLVSVASVQLFLWPGSLGALSSGHPASFFPAAAAVLSITHDSHLFGDGGGKLVWVDGEMPGNPFCVLL